MLKRQQALRNVLCLTKQQNVNGSSFLSHQFFYLYCGLPRLVVWVEAEAQHLSTAPTEMFQRKFILAKVYSHTSSI